MRRGKFAALSAAMLATIGVTGPQAWAVDAPAYGAILIEDDGTGFVAVWTYDELLWACETAVEGRFTAPVAVTVTCTPRGQQRFACPLMVLTVTTGLPGARAGGRATCTGSLDTGVISGVETATRTGNLGRAPSVVCRAYGPGGLEGVLVPPYSVRCAEPGLPTG